MMAPNFSYLLVFLLFLAGACKNEKPSNVVSANNATNQSTLKDGPTKLTVNLNQLRLRSEAGEEGKEIAKLLYGTVLEDMGEVSDFTTKVKLRGIPYNEPWIKVKTPEGQEGWVYAGGVTFDLKNPTRLSRQLQEKRLQSLFGKDLANQLNTYREAYENIKTSEDFSKIYRKSMTLRDTLMTILTDKVLIDNPEQLPDLFWLEDVMPGFVPAVVAEGTTYYMFRDYKEMLAKTAATQGEEDDAFTQLCLAIHLTDSIEYFFPSWFLQTWDYGGSSLLGTGVHYQLLGTMDTLLRESSYFETEVDELKKQLISDIVGPNEEYWESQKDILKELDQILKSDYQLLTKADRLALATRRKMFKQPKANKIVLNQRAGF